MKIALDTSHLFIAREGIARYLRGLLKGFATVGTPGMEIETVAWPVENFGFQQPLRAMKTAYREGIWGRIIAPVALRLQKFDLLHSQGDIIPPSLFPNQVITLHDLARLRFPQFMRPWNRLMAGNRLSYLHQARRIHCISHFTADEAHRLLGIPLSKIEVIHLGVDALPVEEPTDAFRATIPESYFLFVSALKPNKNIRLLREIYLLAESRSIALPPLLLVGARMEGCMSEGTPPASWKFLGHVSDATLGWLYSRAEGLLFPSLYEGFGFPPAEAMRLRCPVLCGRVASLPEVCGEGAFYSELSPEPFLETMRQVLSEPNQREDKVEEGYQHSLGFSWEKCAREHLELYASV
ncbi:glycosyltransferase family 1 protein [Verrucomicrobium sp. GAS474]|uniref:glycosyltransferase family 4 protein n=1 Tax=Verrucomicrobium sp. GAS474 TaxID=1882831 RepID=UPI00139051B2|nr:glycosyltransferase family 1 protein [Verrucomicrobium sp. GAS474]